MIPANELRIGDWAYDNKLNGNVKFTSFYGLCNVENNPDDYDPIPLTPEVLEKCGFDYTESLHRLGELEIGYDNEDFMLMQYSLRYKKAIILKVKYLHQLQNFYFALTGEELTVKL